MIFIDSGAFLARYMGKDQYHEQAVATWEQLAVQSEALATSNFVLDETFTLLGRRVGNVFAVQRAKSVYASKILNIYRPVHEDEVNALALFGKYADQHVSFTDCVSFVLMKRNRNRRVFSFDRHFDAAGFQRIP